jgi:hypothetical protein
MKLTVEMISGGMINIPSFMKIAISVQAILRFCLRKVRNCNVGITEGRDSLMTPLRWAQCLDIHTKFHKDWFPHSKVNRGIHIQTDKHTQTAR